MVATKTKNAPHAKETDNKLNNCAWCFFNSLHKRTILRLDDQMGHITRQNEQRIEREANKEHVEEAVVALANTVPNPWTVVVEFLNTIVTNRAVRGPGRPVQLTGKAVFQFDRFPLDFDLFEARHLTIVYHLRRLPTAWIADRHQSLLLIV